MDKEITSFAVTTYRNKLQKFGIKTDDRRRHMYLIGKTGMGKSTILENMIVDDIRAGKGVAVVDPHGDLAEKVMDYIPSERINDVIYFNPADMDFPIAFNVVEQVEPHLRHLVASGLIGVFQKLWADSWGPRLEYILRNAILAILDYPGSTLLAVTRMLSDKAFRKKVIAKIQDPVVKAFWVGEFAGYADKFASEAVSPIQNKVGQFLSSSLIRNIVGQVRSAVDMREIMDNKKILIMNLSKGRIGEDNSALLGAMMITKIQLAAMSRVDTPEKDRQDFYLYIDEFQNFVTEAFANILSEARKYHLNLIMAHQYVEQLGDTVKAAVFGNVGTLVVFRVGAIDAEELVKEFTPVFMEEDIVNLPKYEFYIKLMIDGISSDPFSARGLFPLTTEELTGNTEKVIRVSRERYAKKKEEVEEKIMRWVENDGQDTPDTKKNIIPANKKPVARNNSTAAENLNKPKIVNSNTNIKNTSVNNPVSNDSSKNNNTNIKLNNNPSSGNKKVINSTASSNKANTNTPNNSIYIHSTVCNRCGNETKTSFKPDGVRPVYCRECLSALKEEKKNDLESRKKAKQEELKNIDSIDKKEEKSVSLNDAIKMKPVEFTKKENKPKIVKNNKDIGDIKEGEEVNF